MNKQELIETLAEATGSSKASIASTIDAIIGAVTGAVANGEAVRLVGLGTFASGARAARVGRNPATSAEMHIGAAKTVRFTAGKAYKEAENAG